MSEGIRVFAVGTEIYVKQVPEIKGVIGQIKLANSAHTVMYEISHWKDSEQKLTWVCDFEIGIVKDNANSIWIHPLKTV